MMINLRVNNFKFALPRTFLGVIFLFLTGALYIISVAGDGREHTAADPPNILWIIAEDIGLELGVYGTSEVRTPNLDRLAQAGMVFTHAFTTNPVCSPSRSAFNTGMYETTIGAHNHRSHRPDGASLYPFPLPDGVEVISDWLRPSGYFTGNIVHFPDRVDLGGTGKTDWNFSYEGEPFDTNVWNDLKAHQPFYAQVNFPETHRVIGLWSDAHEHIPHPADPKHVEMPPYYPDHPVSREDWANYLNAVMVLDQKVGRLVDLLEEEDLADNTVVIFMGDHGRATVRGKQWPYDSGLGVPLIIYWPEGIAPPEHYEVEEQSDQFISAIDVTATTLAMAGISKPDEMQGRVFLGPAAEPSRRYVFGSRDRMGENVDRIRTVRSERYRYIRKFVPDRPF